MRYVKAAVARAGVLVKRRRLVRLGGPEQRRAV